MKAVVILSVLLVSALAVSTVEETLLRDMYSQWKLAHKKTYKSAIEDELRFATFAENYLTIVATNRAQSDVVLGLNQFADLSREEFAAQYTGYRPSGERRNAPIAPVNAYTDLPSKVDWREKGAVNDVKNQGSCGSCWAFSAVGALEALYFLENSGKLLSFSEQHLVDCDTQSEGCNGGLMTYAFEYTAFNGLELGSDYPYVARDQKCAAVKSKSYKINTAYLEVEPKSVTALKSAIAGQPVSVAIQADQAVFQFYKAGVIIAGCGDDLNHGVLAVGYDTFVGVEAFIVKNSWGTTWGNKGYVLISTNGSANNGNGVCGILADNCYPTRFH